MSSQATVSSQAIRQRSVARHGRAAKVLAAAATAAVLVVCGSAAGRAAEFRLKAQCQCQGSLVTLGDVAEIFAADREQAAKLARIELFPSPAATRQRFVRMREIQDLLLLRGVDLSEHRFSGSSQVAILGAGGPVRTERERPVTFSIARRADRRICDAVVSYLQQHVSADRPWNVTVQLSESQARLAADPTRTISIAGGNPPWSGLQRFEVTVSAPEGPMRFSLDAQVEIPPAVVVTVRSLSRGELISAADVELRHGNPQQGPSGGFHSIDEVVGMETIRAVAEGKTLARESVRSPVLVHRGAPVTVIARSAGIRVQTMARAREEGSLGDLITVESLSDRTKYFARVTGVREVEVYARSVRTNPTP